MSPRCTTASTFGSALISSTHDGNAANWASLYGRSPMTASVSGFADAGLIGVPLPAAAPSAITSTASNETTATVRCRFILVPLLGSGLRLRPYAATAAELAAYTAPTRALLTAATHALREPG